MANPPQDGKPYENKEYQFWHAALQFLEPGYAPPGTLENFEHAAQNANGGNLSSSQWNHVMGKNSYSAALRALQQWFRRVPPGTQIPADIMIHYNWVINHRIKAGNRHGGLDRGHQAALDNWRAVGTVLANMCGGTLYPNGTINLPDPVAPAGYIYKMSARSSAGYYVVANPGSSAWYYVAAAAVVGGAAVVGAALWWIFGPK